MGISKGTCQIGNLIVRLQHLTDLIRNLTQSLHNLQIFVTFDGSFGFSHCQRNHRQHSHLTCKGLCGSHTNLRTYVNIGTRISGAGNTRTDGVTDTIDECTFLLGQLYGS